MTQGHPKKRQAPNEMSHTKLEEGSAHELAYLRRKNEEHKCVIENLNEKQQRWLKPMKLLSLTTECKARSFQNFEAR